MASLYVIKGDKQLLKQLQILGDSEARAIMRSAVSAGLNPILKQARANAPGQTIPKLIQKRVRTFKGKISGMVYVKESGTRTVKDWDGREADFAVVASALEFGIPRIGVAPRKFMRDARESRSFEALKIVRDKANERLNLFWGKAKAA